MHASVRSSILTAACLAAACGSSSRDERSRPADNSYAARNDAASSRADSTTRTTPLSSSSGTIPPAASPFTTRVDIDRVVDVPADRYAGRTYFYGPGDPTHVYWYDVSNPGAWKYVPVYREGDRAYVLELNDSHLERIYFDNGPARDFSWTGETRWTFEERDLMRLAARSDWARREPVESDWRRRWVQKMAMGGASSTSPSTAEPDLSNVVDVRTDAYPDRTYFYDPADSTHVFWLDSADQNTWLYRPIYREGERTYFIERDGSSIRRIWFDDRTAREFDVTQDPRWNAAERGTMRSAARKEWTRRQMEESAWRDRWDRQLATATPPSPSGTTSSSGNVVDIDKVVDVAPETYAARNYFYAPGDTSHVYWFDRSTPDSWSYRPVYRAGDRTYILERDGDSVRRIYFDDRGAREFELSRETKWSSEQREQMLKSAREEWTRRERDEIGWRNRWMQKYPNDVR